MPQAKPTSQTTRAAVLSELAAMAEGRHPDCNTITGRFVRDPELQHASKILCDAIQAEYRRHATGDITPPPPAWLLPA
jgi:hypothetical protein